MFYVCLSIYGVLKSRIIDYEIRNFYNDLQRYGVLENRIRTQDIIFFI